MPKYVVDVNLATVSIELDADDEAEAILAAIESCVDAAYDADNYTATEVPA